MTVSQTQTMVAELTAHEPINITCVLCIAAVSKIICMIYPVISMPYGRNLS